MILNHHYITVQIRYSQGRLDIFIYSRQHRVYFSRGHDDIFWSLLVDVIKNNRVSQPSDILVYLSSVTLILWKRNLWKRAEERKPRRKTGQTVERGKRREKYSRTIFLKHVTEATRETVAQPLPCVRERKRGLCTRDRNCKVHEVQVQFQYAYLWWRVERGKGKE